MYNYSISMRTKDGRVAVITSKAILAEFEARGVLAPWSLNDIVTNGMRYSNQDFDVLSQSMRVLAAGSTTPEAIWEQLAR